MNSFCISFSGSKSVHRGLFLSTLACFIATSLPLSPAVAQGTTSRAPASKVVPKNVDKPAEKSDKSDKAPEKSGDKSVSAKESTKPAPEPVIENVVSCQPEDLVAKPHEYMGKNVKFLGNFFAFSNLGLDYKPAFRSSKTHLSFLILRSKSHVPLSELKLAMAIPKEKDPDTQLLATLKDGDSLEIIGKVFGAALDDPWVEVLRMKRLNTPADDKKADAGPDAATKGKPVDLKSSGDNKPATGTKPKVAPKN